MKRSLVFSTALATLAAAVMLIASCSDGRSVESAMTGVSVDPAAEAAAADVRDGADHGEESSSEAFDAASVEGQAGQPYDPEANIDLTLLPADENVVIGELDNGLVYYLRHNDSPGERLEARLVVKAGSVNDPDSAAGAAHFLEHMLFNGTERYPDNELEQVLRDAGVKLGPDLNAYTSFDQTVYWLSVSTVVPGAVNTAFDVLSEWAHAASITEQGTVAERGIVHDEYLLRTSSGLGRVELLVEELRIAGTPYEGKRPIGNPDAIKSMTAQTLRDFYDSWYRPSNMAVVVVGDMAVEDLERLVREHFEGLEARGPELERPVFVVEPAAEPLLESAAFSGAGPNRVSLSWSVPEWPEGTVGGERLIFMEQLIIGMLTNRLTAEFNAGRLAQTSEPYITDAPVGTELRFQGTNLVGDNLTAATTDFLSVLTGAARAGFTQQELDRITEAVRVRLDAAVEAEATRQDGSYAAQYTQHFLEGTYVADAQQSRDWYLSLLEDFSADDLSRHWKWLWERSVPIIVAAGENAEELPTVEELNSAIAAVQPRDLAEAEPRVEALMAVPAPTAPVSSRSLGLLEGYAAYEWRFANGAVVVHVESDISEALVNMEARSLGGSSVLAPDEAGLAWVAVSAVSGSGLGSLSSDQLHAYQDTSTAWAQPMISEIQEGVSGASSPEHLEDLFALLHLYHTEPRISPVSLRSALSNAHQTLDYSDVYPPLLLQLAYLAARHPDNPWQMLLPTREQIESATVESLLELYERRLGGVDDLLVAVVGDIDRETVANLAARYVGTLPAGEPDTFVNRRSPHPEGVTRTDVRLVDSSGTSVSIYYDSPVEVTPKLRVTSDVLGTVLAEQMLSAVRKELGDTYAVSAAVLPVLTAEPLVLSQFSASGEVQFLDDIYDQMTAVIRVMVDEGPGDSDFEQAKKIVADDYTLVHNHDLIEVVLQRHFFDDADLLTPGRLGAELESLTAADVHALARQLYGPGHRIEIFGLLAE